MMIITTAKITNKKNISQNKKKTILISDTSENLYPQNIPAL